MQEFQYTATDAQGQLQTGRLTAENQAAAEQILVIERGWNLVQLQPVVAEEESKGRLNRSSSEQLANLLADLTNSDLPLEAGLRMLGEELSGQSPLTGWKNRQRLERLASLLEQGLTLDEALERQGAPPDLIAAVRAGARSGNVGRALTQYVTYVRSLSTLRGRIALGFSYPVMLMVVASTLFGMVMVYIVPQFSEIFDGFGIEVPAITTSIINTALFLKHYGLWVILGLVGALAVSIAVLRRLPAYPRRRILLALPLIGPMVEAVSMSRFTHALGFLTENGVPMPESLRLAGQSAEDAVIARTASQWADCLEAGESLSQVSTRIRGIPAELFQMFSYQRDDQFFSRALHALGEMYEGRARIQTATMVALAEPTVVVVIGFLFVAVVIGLFFPLIKLMNDFS